MLALKAKNVLDRFHIKSHLTDAVNETRKMDAKKLQSEGREAVLTKSKSIFFGESGELDGVSIVEVVKVVTI